MINLTFGYILHTGAAADTHWHARREAPRRPAARQRPTAHSSADKGVATGAPRRSKQKKMEEGTHSKPRDCPTFYSTNLIMPETGENG